MTRKDPHTKFWRNVEKTDTCWVWTGYRDPQGYGRFSTRFDDKTYPWLAHRVAWRYHYGDWPQTDALDHRCENHACVRVDHLDDVGRKINTQRYFERRGNTCKYGHTDRYTNSRGRKVCRECNRIRGRGGKPAMQTDAGA